MACVLTQQDYYHMEMCILATISTDAKYGDSQVYYVILFRRDRSYIYLLLWLSRPERSRRTMYRYTVKIFLRGSLGNKFDFLLRSV